GLQRLSVDATGANYVSRQANLLPRVSDFRFLNGLLYGSSGEVIDPSGPSLRDLIPSVDGSSQVLPDPIVGRLFFSYGSVLRVHDLNSRLYLTDIPLTGISGPPQDLTRCGSDAVAFRTAGDLLFILRHPLLARGAESDIAVTMTGPASPALTQSNLIFTLTLTNRGPFPINGASLVAYRPTASALLSA